MLALRFGLLFLRRPGVVFLRLGFHFFHLAPQLVERRDGVGLLLDVEIVNVLFLEIDDLAARVVGVHLPIAGHGHGGDHAFLGGLAAEEIHHAAKHAAEGDEAFLFGFDVRVQDGNE